MALDQITSPFGSSYQRGMSPEDVEADSIRTPLSKQELTSISPGTEPQKITDLSNASNNFAWGEASGFGVNEKVFFDNQYRQVARRYYQEAGDVAIKVFSDFYPVALGAALRLVKDVRDGTFVGEVAEGSEQFLLRPIVPDTYGVAETDLEQRPGGTGRVNNYIPGNSPVDNQQCVLNYGYIMTTDPTAIVAARDEVDDTIGERQEVGIQDTTGTSDSNIVPRESVTYVQNDNTYNLNLIVAKDELTDIFPMGVDIIAANQVAP